MGKIKIKEQAPSGRLVRARRVAKGHWLVICPFCYTQHHHGKLGVRQAPCLMGAYEVWCGRSRPNAKAQATPTEKNNLK